MKGRENGLHLVYVRRKSDSEQPKNTICNKSEDLHVKQCEEDQKNHQQSSKDSPIQIQKPVHVPEPETSSEGVSSTLPSVNINNQNKLSVCHWKERYSLLQNFLKVLDQSTQDDYREMLRFLSSVDLSRVAADLERRTIQLSMEEGERLVNISNRLQKEEQPAKNVAQSHQPGVH